MSDAFDISALPFAVGESSFHLKGNMFAGEIEYIEKTVPGGLPGVLGAIEDPALVGYLGQRFLAANWYDVFPQVALTQAAARLAKKSYTDFAVQMGVAQARRDIRGVYRMLLKFAAPERIIERMPRLAKQYFDFVDSEVREKGPGHYEAIVYGVPLSVVDSYRSATSAFLIEALVAAGAKNLRHEWSKMEAAPRRHGIEIVTLTRVMRWDV